MGFQWHCYPDSKTASSECAAFTVARLEPVLSSKDYATVALSGGSTPQLLFEQLAACKFPWNQVHFFWVDERMVPPDDPASNYRLAAETFFGPAKVPDRNIHRIRGEDEPELAAREYIKHIRKFFGLEIGEMPQFDLVHCGMGPEGHTASLFPGEPLVEERERIAAAVYNPKLEQWRVTLLPGVLLAGAETVMLVTGPDKAEAVRATFHEPYHPVLYPAQLGAQGRNPITWFLDRAAAHLLEEDD